MRNSATRKSVISRPRNRSRRLWRLLAAGALAASALAAQVADPIAEVERDHVLSPDFETPHTRWARPYAAGRVRALFFTIWLEKGTYPREIVELMQRFDLDAEAVYYHRPFGHLVGDDRPERFGDEKAGTRRLLRLLEQPRDVYFFNHLNSALLPPEAQAELRARIAAGAGLVVVGEADSAASSLCAGAQPFEALPAGMRSGSFCGLGEGRVALLPPREPLEYAVGWETAFDYQMEQQGRALLWAADRGPTLDLEVQLSADELVRAELPARAATVRWSEAGPGTRVRVELRRWDGRQVPLRTVDAVDVRSVPLEIPRLRAGEYHLDAFAEGEQGIESWATRPFAVTSARRVQAVDLDQDWGEIGDELSGRVRLSGVIQPDDRIRIQLVDKNGRALVRQDLEIGGRTSLPFRFAVENWLPMLVRVEALLLDREHEVSWAAAFFQVTRRQRGQFHLLVWGHAQSDLAPYAVESMAREGVSLAVTWGGRAEPVLAASEISLFPYSTSIHISSRAVTNMLDSTGVLRGGCFYDDEHMEEYVRSRVVERHRGARQHGVFAYSLGDENAVRHSCLSPICLTAYRTYLEEEYSEIESLNREWETDFSSFASVELSQQGELPSPDAPRWFAQYYAQHRKNRLTDNELRGEWQIGLGEINDELRSLQAENFPRWYDRQVFQLRTYVEQCKRYARAYKEIDPEALTGFEGAGTFSLQRHITRTRKGGDLDLFLREVEFWGPYPGATTELIRSIAPPGYPSGNWLGYSMDADVLLKKVWDQVTNNLNVIQWWAWNIIDDYHGFLSPDLTVFPATREMLDDMQVLWDGLGTLLMRSQTLDDGIAVLYSLPSTYMAHFDGNPTYGKYERDHLRWHRLIHDTGMQFRYVTDRMLRRGEFEAPRYKVLILPLAFAIGSEEAEVIRDFVRRGGTVIADVRPGLYDGHCKPLEVGALDDVFGIRQSGRPEAVEIDRMNIAGEVNGQAVAMSWGEERAWGLAEWEQPTYPPMKIDPSVEPTTGEALGAALPFHFRWKGLDNPVCMVNRFGAGRAVLLNFPVFDAPAGQLVQQLLTAAGVAPTITAKGPEGGHASGVEVTRWRNGEIELVALYGSYGGEVRVELSEERFVYDLRARQALGRTRSFATTVRPFRARFLALLPRAAPVPELELEKEKAARGTPVKLALSIPGAAGQHALRLRVFKPAGAPAEFFDRTLIAGAEAEEVTLPFSYDDAPGEWRIEAIDLYTNEATATHLRLQ